jgi:hypothetical protein
MADICEFAFTAEEPGSLAVQNAVLQCRLYNASNDSRIFSGLYFFRRCNSSSCEGWIPTLHDLPAFRLILPRSFGSLRSKNGLTYSRINEWTRMWYTFKSEMQS